MQKLANYCKVCGRELKEGERILGLCTTCRESAGEKPIEKIISDTITMRSPKSAFDNIPALVSFFFGVMGALNYFFYHILYLKLKIGLGMPVDDLFTRFSMLLAGLVLGIIGLMQHRKSHIFSYLGILLILLVFFLLLTFK